MATVYYDKAVVEVRLGDQKEQLLASDCSLNYAGAQQPLYAVGTKGSLGQFPSAARAGDVSFSFLTSITGNFFGYNGNIINTLASGIKNNVTNGSETSGVEIKFAGVSGSGFLTSYGLGVAANSISSSNAAFTFFGSGDQLPFSGRLAPVDGMIVDDNEGKLSTGIAHGRYTNLDNFRTVLASPTDTANVFGAEYSLSLNYTPIYKVGQEFPVTCLYTNAQESVTITEDVFDSGLEYNGLGNQEVTLTVSGLPAGVGGLGVHLPGMEIGISGYKVVSTSMSAGLDDIVRTQKTLTAAY